MNRTLESIGAATADMADAQQQREETAANAMPAVVERARRQDRERARVMRRLTADELWTRCAVAVDSMRRLTLDPDERADLISDLVTDRLEWSAKTAPAESVGRVMAKRAPNAGRAVCAYLLAVERATASKRGARQMRLADSLSVTDRDASPRILALRLADMLNRGGRWRTVQADRELVAGRWRPTSAMQTVGADASDAPANGRKRGALLDDSDGETDAAPSPWTRLLAVGADPDAPAAADSADAETVADAVGAALLWSGRDPNAYALIRGALDYWRPVRGRETEHAIDGVALAQELGVSPDSARQRIARGRRVLLAAVAVERVPMLGTVLEMPRDPRQQRTALRELLRDALAVADIAAPDRDPDGPALNAARRAVERAQRVARTDAAMRTRPRMDVAPTRPADALLGADRTRALLRWLTDWQSVPGADIGGPSRPTPPANGSLLPLAQRRRLLSLAHPTPPASMDPADRDPAPDPDRQQRTRDGYGYGGKLDGRRMAEWQRVSRAGAYMDRYWAGKLAQGGAG